MKEFGWINPKFTWSKIEIDCENIAYLEDSVILLQGKIEGIKSFFINPLKPIYINGILILIDYENGINLLSKNNTIYLPIKAVIKAEVVDKILIAHCSRKICFVNLKSGVIEKEISAPEVCWVLKDNDAVLFHKLKYNKSYLHLFDENRTIELKNFPKEDNIVSIRYQYGCIYAFHFHGIFEYDVNKQKIINRYSCERDCTVANYIDCLTSSCSIRNDCNIDIKQCDYPIQFAKLLFKKYGAYITVQYAYKALNKDNLCDFAKILVKMNHLLDYTGKNRVHNTEELNVVKAEYSKLNKQMEEAIIK